MARQLGSRRENQKCISATRRRRLHAETLEKRVVLSATLGMPDASVGKDSGAADLISQSGPENPPQIYRLAIAATAEYTDQLGGQDAAYAAIESFVSDLNQIASQNSAGRFELVSGPETVFTDSASDGFTNGNVELMRKQGSSILLAALGADAYDVSHSFGTAISGSDFASGRTDGASLSSDPQGDQWVQSVAQQLFDQVKGGDAGDQSKDSGGYSTFSSSATEVSIAATNAVQSEGDSSTTAFTFTVTRSVDVSGTLTVDYAVTGSGSNPASASDFGGTLPTGTVSFAEGVLTQLVTIDVSGDLLVEFDEGFDVTLSNASDSATITTPTASGTINNDDTSEVVLSVDAASITEDAAGLVTFTLTRDNVSSESPALSVGLALGGSANSGSDYTASDSTSVDFAVGEATTTVTIDPSVDSIVEPDETVELSLVSGTGYTLGSPSVQSTTINNDDTSEVSVAVDPNSILEDAAGELTYTFTRSNTSSETPELTINFGIGGTATGGSDFTASASGTVSFAAGSATTSVTVDPTEDVVLEPDETVAISVDPPTTTSYAVGSPSLATGTLSNDDTAAVTVEDVVAVEGVGLVFTVTLDNAVDGSFDVTASFVDGTATGGSDFTATAQVLSFAGNASETQQFTVPTTVDSTVEFDETFTVNLTATNGLVDTTDTATGTITNDDESTVSVAVGPMMTNEDDPGVLTYTFTRDNVSAESPGLTIGFAISGSATASDYTASATTTVDFAPGQATTTVTIDPITDTTVETDETVEITLTSGGGGYNIGSPNSAIGTIVNDDTSDVSVAVSPASINEDDAGVLTYTFTRTDTSAESPGLTIDFTTTGTASVDDFVASATGSVSFAAGSATTTVTVDPEVDGIFEADETVIIEVTDGLNYDLGTTVSASGTITNDDFSDVIIGVDLATIAEEGGGTVTFTLTRDNISAESPATTISFTTTGTTTPSGGAADYTASAVGTVEFAQGAATTTVTITPIDDPIVEADETVILTLVDGAEYNLGAATSATTTILNVDISDVEVSVSPAAVNEDSGTLTYTFTRNNTSGETPERTITYGTSGTATFTEDYTTNPAGTVTFAVGAATATMVVTPVVEPIVEPDETVIITVLDGTDYLVGETDSATGTILNDDISDVSVVVTPTSLNENDPGTYTYTFTRTNTSDETPALTINFNSVGSATSDFDYTPSHYDQITFEEGSATTLLDVDPTEDTFFEPDETVVVNVLSGANYNVAGADNSATATILNDDSESPTPFVESIIYYNDDAAAEQAGLSQDDTGQRSIIRNIEVTFSGPVTVQLGAVTDDSFVVESTDGATKGQKAGLEVVSSDLVDGKQVVVLKFTGTDLIESISRRRGDAMLIDGDYEFRINGAELNIDANGPERGVVAVDEFYRLFGDTDGDRDVDSDDHALFLDYQTGTTTPGGIEFALFDFDDNTRTQSKDRAEFLERLGTYR